MEDDLAGLKRTLSPEGQKLFPIKEKVDTVPPLIGNNTLLLNNSRGGAENEPKVLHDCYKPAMKWGQFSTQFDQFLQEAGRLDKRELAELLGVKRSDDNFRTTLARRMKDGQVRPFRNSTNIIEWVKRDWKEQSLHNYAKSTFLDISLPLGIDMLAELPPRSVMGVAGCTSAGKTAFALELAALNVYTQNMPVYYWFNEMSYEKFAIRCEDFPILIEAQEKGVFHPVLIDDFEVGDVVEPDAINIYDYLDRDENFYFIGDDIKKLYRPLRTGVVVFLQQKTPGAWAGHGGTMAVKLSNLYVTLDTHEQTDGGMVGVASIIKCKDYKSNTNPVGKSCYYYTGGKHGKLFQRGEWTRVNKGGK
ncbi:hypothetical protein ACFLX3_01550 [Chloroflexota bacterium]